MKNIYIILLAIVFLASSCGKPVEEGTNTEQAAPVEKRSVKVGQLQVKPLLEKVRATGSIDVPPMERRVLHSYIGANLTYLGVIQGESVRSGQVLAKLSHPNLIKLQQQLLEEKVEIDFQSKELARKRTLLASNATSEKEINAIERALNKAQIRFNTLSAQLELLGISHERVEQKGPVKVIEIKAPFDAKVSKVHVQNGQFIDMNQPLIELLNEDHKHLELDVFAQDAGKIEIGQLIEFKIPGKNEIYEAEVYLINPDLDSNKLRVHGHLKDESLKIKIGTYIEAEIIINNDAVALIENEELIREGNLFYLFKKSSTGYEKVQVSIGRSNENFTEILNFNNTNQWVLEGNYYLQDF